MILRELLPLFLAQDMRIEVGKGEPKMSNLIRAIYGLATCLVLVTHVGCAATSVGTDGPQLDFTDDQDDKADDLFGRPYGTWLRQSSIMGQVRYGVQTITLNRDRSFYYANICSSVRDCKNSWSGRFAFATSGADRYVVLYDSTNPSKSETIAYWFENGRSILNLQRSTESAGRFVQAACDDDDDCYGIPVAPGAILECVAGFCDMVSHD